MFFKMCLRIFFPASKTANIIILAAALLVLSHPVFSQTHIRLHFYTRSPLEAFSALAREFEKENTDVKITYSQKGKGNEMRSWMRRELASGRHTFDGALLHLNADVKLLIEEFRNQLLVLHETVPSQMPTLKNYWTEVFKTGYVLAYNTNLFEGKRPPTWQDLSDGKYHFAIDPYDFTWYDGLIACMGEAAAQNFLRTLAASGKLNLRKGDGIRTAMIIAGEIWTGIIKNFHVTQARKTGAPIAWSEQAPPFITRSAVIILKRGPHEKLARRFLDFLLSEKGQMIIAREGGIPIHVATTSTAERISKTTCHLDPPVLTRDEVEKRQKDFQSLLEFSP